MKKGKIITAAALVLCFSTLLWAMQKQIPHATQVENSAQQQPDEQSADHLFYKADQVPFANVTGPFHVLLDPTFDGVKIEGDSAFFKYIEVRTDIGTRNGRGTSVGLKSSDKSSSADSAFLAELGAAKLKLRIGIKNMAEHTGDLRFRNCSSVASTEKLINQRLSIGLSEVKITTIEVGAEYLNLSYGAFGIGRHATAAAQLSEDQVLLSGSTKNLYISEVFGVTLNTENLRCKELYIAASHTCKLHLFAFEILNIKADCACDYTVLGNPPYEKVEVEGSAFCPQGE